MADWEQLSERRRTHRIPLARIQRRLGCSLNWLRELETGNYIGPCGPRWKSRYEEALRELVAKRKELIDKCR